MKKQQIHVYAGKGVDGGSLKQLMRSLQQEVNLSQCEIKRIDAEELIESQWQDFSSLLIMPGGRDIFYHQDLSGRGTEKIRAFVERGGGYLGICAGAYFASQFIEFEKGGTLEVCGERFLKFFPGIATGPAYGLNQYSYENTQGVKPAHIFSKWGEGHLYFNGGCSFNFDSVTSPDIEIMGYYADIPHQPPALIKRSYGKGLVHLSGVHFEYRTELLNKKDPYLSPVIPLLVNSETFRRKLFRFYLSAFQIPLEPIPVK